jgi:hypothetical protein
MILSRESGLIADHAIKAVISVKEDRKRVPTREGASPFIRGHRKSYS